MTIYDHIYYEVVTFKPSSSYLLRQHRSGGNFLKLQAVDQFFQESTNSGFLKTKIPDLKKSFLYHDRQAGPRPEEGAKV